MRQYLLVIILLVLPFPLTAQHLSEGEGHLSDEEGLLSEVDLSLFSLHIDDVDSYAEATKYYRPQLSYRRRGVDWWVVNKITEPVSTNERGLEVAEPLSRVRVFASTKDYNIGIAGEYATTLSSGWNIAANLNLKTGSDLSIKGLFTQEARGDIEVSRRFSQGHFISVTLDAPILTHALQSAASQETTTLSGDYRYNPSWGLYDGEVRNSRVVKYAVPQLAARYQRPINESTRLLATLAASAGRRSVSRLGWYDAYNPSPDYYQKLPSYISNASTKLAVEQAWRDNDTNYTQIAWDNLVRYNQLSSDGSAHYLLEDQTKLQRMVELSPTFISKAGERLELSYGILLSLQSERCFKEVVDLLGAEYHLDHDLFIGDNVHLGNNMQNDLRNPDREVGVGDRFGYDYTSLRTMWGLRLGLDYRADALNVTVRALFGEQTLWRIGHYEKERFPASQSYGKSSAATLANNHMTLNVGYTLSRHQRLSLRATLLQSPNDDSDTFVQIQNANRLVDNPTHRRFTSLNLAYRYDDDRVSLDVEGYLLFSRNECQVWSSYDDLSYTYTNVVTSGIGTRSIGLDIVAKYRVSRELEWHLSLAVGDYTYDLAPTVTLYDDSDMTQLSSTRASAVEGCKVGNAPQVLATTSLTYMPQYRWIVALNLSCGAGRYIAPSMTRRSDRVVLAASYSPELMQSIVTQSSMPAVFDATLNVTRMVYLSDGRRLSATMRVGNLLGERDRISYGRESNRILTTAAGSSVGSQYLQPDYYCYGTARTFYLSCSYAF